MFGWDRARRTSAHMYTYVSHLTPWPESTNWFSVKQAKIEMQEHLLLACSSLCHALLANVHVDVSLTSTWTLSWGSVLVWSKGIPPAGPCAAPCYKSCPAVVQKNMKKSSKCWSSLQPTQIQLSIQDKLSPRNPQDHLLHREIWTVWFDFLNFKHFEMTWGKIK